MLSLRIIKFATNYEKVLTLTTSFVAGMFGAGGLYIMNKSANAHSAAADAQEKVAEALKNLANAHQVNIFFL